ncbi:galactosylceramide sulfotransferase-like [Saccoglossus kowalevskii]|uniref:Galactosylceramide sulfotransferase-like n=1 Tax=Saccoglossus kowalevskii TaxID=10224 RepID=A0ABM0GJN5_SACKO|nr:PREDICTED: galactosylceramide sulfotransferase-like [Saccoglossus kowalevskii]
MNHSSIEGSMFIHSNISSGPPVQTSIINRFLEPDHGDNREKLNIVYIKSHKTGGTTVSSILNRFGYKRNLSFAMNSNKNWNGHLRELPLTRESPKDVLLPSLDGGDDWMNYRYNIMDIHVRYNRNVMDMLMMGGTKYIALLRDPVYQLESAFDFFGLAWEIRSLRKKPNAFQLFMTNPDKHMRWASKARRIDLRNNQFHMLGLENKFFNDVPYIKTRVEELDREFDLVMILEHFDESLLLLKKLMNWEFEDILYIKKNQRLARSNINEDISKKVRKWNAADDILYKYFEEKLLARIQEYGASFNSDLIEFQRMNEIVFDRCTGGDATKQHNNKIFEYNTKEDTDTYCNSFVYSFKDWVNIIWESQHLDDPTVES